MLLWKATAGVFVDEVRRLRREKGWNQNELAYHAKLAPSVISLIETGKREPNATTLRKLADALEVRIPDLFEEGGSGKAPRRSTPEPSANDVLAGERRIAVDFDGLQMRLEEFCAYWEGILEERTPDDRVLDRRDLDPLDLDRFDASSKVIAPMIRELMGVEMVQLGSQEPGSEARFYSERSAWGPGIMRFANLDIRMRKLSGDQFGEAQPISDEVAQIRRMAS